jgi:hypothetical protein
VQPILTVSKQEAAQILYESAGLTKGLGVEHAATISLLLGV